MTDSLRNVARLSDRLTTLVIGTSSAEHYLRDYTGLKVFRDLELFYLDLGYFSASATFCRHIWPL